jgi:hypothetical protein
MHDASCVHACTRTPGAQHRMRLPASRAAACTHRACAACTRIMHAQHARAPSSVTHRTHASSMLRGEHTRAAPWRSCMLLLLLHDAVCVTAQPPRGAATRRPRLPARLREALAAAKCTTECLSACVQAGVQPGRSGTWLMSGLQPAGLSGQRRQQAST